MALALGVIELGAYEGLGIGGIAQTCLHLGHGKAGKLLEEFRALGDLLSKLVPVIGEAQKRRRGGKLLSLELQRRLRREQQQRCFCQPYHCP